MAHRLPSIRELENNSGNVPSIIAAAHRDTLEELNGLESGALNITDGRTRSYHLKLTHERMARIRAHAKHFGIYLPEA